MYFTIWYGVYRRSTRELVYAAGGHPPAVLLPAAAPDKPVELNSPNAIIGALPGIEFHSQRVTLAPGDRLYVFSDGVYEVNYGDRPEVMMTLEEFSTGLARPAATGQRKVDDMVDFVRRAQGRKQFEDDFSLVEINFF
jgi:sigma-B regulation protein RsbU (phosphoserine phosphatase)